MRGRRVAALLSAVALVAALTSCRPGGSSGRPTVVAGFYPLFFIAEEIAGRYNDVIDLTPPGVEPHEYELTIRQVASINEARVGFYEHGVAPSIDQAMANDPPAHALDVTSVVPLAAPVAGSGVESTADDRDPHFWQDPTLMAKAATAFTAVMVQADPEHASYYRNREGVLVRALHSLDREYADTLATCRQRTVVVSHDAFEYLARRYHLDVVPIAGLEPDAEPSLSRLNELAGLVKDRGVTTIFFETLTTPDLARSLAADAGVRTAVLDPIEGLSSADPHATYLTLMRQNLAALTKANDCS